MRTIYRLCHINLVIISETSLRSRKLQHRGVTYEERDTLLQRTQSNDVHCSIWCTVARELSRHTPSRYEESVNHNITSEVQLVYLRLSFYRRSSTHTPPLLYNKVGQICTLAQIGIQLQRMTKLPLVKYTAKRVYTRLGEETTGCNCRLREKRCEPQSASLYLPY